MGLWYSARRRLRLREMGLHPYHTGDLVNSSAQVGAEVDVLAADARADQEGPEPAFDALAVGEGEESDKGKRDRSRERKTSLCCAVWQGPRREPWAPPNRGPN